MAKFGLVFTVIAALPVYHLLLIGPDLEKSRVLYLGSVGFAIFFAALCRNVPERLGLVAAVLVVSFQLAALRHNLEIWDRVSQIHLRACEFLGDEAARSPGGVVAVGMPNTWDGVYMLRTGLPECIEMRRGVPSATIHLVDSMEGASRYPNLPIYRWNDATASIVQER